MRGGILWLADAVHEPRILELGLGGGRWVASGLGFRDNVLGANSLGLRD